VGFPTIDADSETIAGKKLSACIIMIHQMPVKQAHYQLQRKSSVNLRMKYNVSLEKIAINLHKVNVHLSTHLKNQT
jgi:hypothetical protein